MCLEKIQSCCFLIVRFGFILVFILLASGVTVLFSSESITTSSFSSNMIMPPPIVGCNDPIVGKGAVVDQLAGSLVSALSGSNASDVIVDGDLTNFIAFNGTDLIGVGAISLVSVKDVNNTYPAGQRTGFVVSAEGGLIGADVLNDLEIRTYLNNQLQETAQVGGGGSPISLALLAGPGSRRRVDFVTTLPFDEVELSLTGVANLSLISALRVYYAYEEVDGCDYNCATALNTANYPLATASTNCELFVVSCLDDGFNNFSNTTNADTTDYASDLFILAESNYLDIDIGENIPANYEVGFAIEQVGLLGLLSLDVLGGITIETYDNGGLVETFIANDALANVGVLTGSINLISFPTTQTFDQVRITISSVLSLATTYRIYYGFVRPDTDGDGFPDCVDQCAGGDDNFDMDGDGTPDFCDDDCMVNAGIDASACTSTMTFTLSPAGAGETWSPVMGNPSAASIDAAGVITGLDMEGYYLFELSNGSCSDTITIAYFASQGPIECNDPIVGRGVVINDNGSCSNCGNIDADNVVDGDLSNYTEESSLLSLSLLGGDTRLISVRDTLQEYPAGLRAGFVLSFPSGLLSLDLLDVFAIQTYNNGVPVEQAGIGSANLLNVDGLGTNGQQRLSFVTTQPFDEVELIIQGGLASLDLLTTARIFYAFTEPTSCPDANTITDITDLCGIPLTASSDYCGGIVYERSGFTGIACVGCTVDSLSNLIDDDLTQPTTIDLLAAALGDVSLSVAATTVVDGGSIAGFAIGIEPSLLDVGLLDNISLTTYLGGVPQETIISSNPLVTASLLNNGSEITYLSFATTLDFDEVQITFDAGLAAVSALGGTISVYYAYVQADSDGDGTPDCLDKCCEGPDTLDADGDGLPDSCENIAIVKNGAFQDENGDGFAQVGETITYSFTVTNLGNVTLTNLTVTDPLVTVSGGPLATLAGGASDNSTFTASYVLTQADIDAGGVTNQALVMGTDTNGNSAMDVSDDNDISEDDPTVTTLPQNSGIAIIKVGTFQDTNSDGLAQAGETITYMFSVANMGNVTLNNVTVTDPLVTVSGGPLATLAVGAIDNTTFTASYVLTQADINAGSVTNQATAMAINPNGDPITDVSDDNDPLEDDLTVTSLPPPFVKLEAKVQLQGALLGATGGLMRDDLRSRGMLPSTEPYTALAAFTHVGGGGGETVADPGTVFADLGNNSIVDWVFVELRSSSNPATVVETRAGLLQKDGDVVGVDGVSSLWFTQSVPGDYFVAVRHRNHLGTMTANTITLTATGVVVNFMDTNLDLWNSQSMYDNREQKVIDGQYALWSGNTLSDDRVVFAGQFNDKDPVFNQVDSAPGNFFKIQTYILPGYNLTDANLDGDTIFAGQNNDVDPIFNNVDGHPANFFKIQTFIIVEQLAQELTP